MSIPLTPAIPPSSWQVELHELLYFGSELAEFVHVKGSVHTEIGPWIVEPDTNEVDLRSKPLAHLGPDYINVVIPAIPAKDLVPSSASTLSALSSSLSTFSHSKFCHLPPPLAATPLLKCPKGKGNGDERSISYKSGIRSALMRLADGRWVRLKGCGNREQGFIVQEVVDRPDLQNLRGSCFPHTAMREVYMTQVVANLLSMPSSPTSKEVDGAPLRMMTANRPLGWYAYDQSPVLPSLHPACGIFETVGDRRLGDHLLAGLEALLPHIHPLTMEAERKALLARFSDLRKQAGEVEGEVMSTPSVTICEMLSEIISITDLPMESPEVEGEGGPLSFPPGLIKQAELVAIASRLYPRVLSHIAALRKRGINAIAALYYRLGQECGWVLRRLHEGGINWGTYTDLLGTHCNAHANNLAVVYPRVHHCHHSLAASSASGSGSTTTATNGNLQHHHRSLLAPLDFDMAFKKEDFLPSINISNQAPFEELMNMERQGLIISLAGDEGISTGVSNETQDLPQSSSVYHSTLRWALRDTLVGGFVAGIDDKQEKEGCNGVVEEEEGNCGAGFRKTIREAFDDIIALALCVTAHRVV